MHVLSAEADSRGGPVVGFVVPKAVGSAVVRNRTKRRLRALIRPLLISMAPSTRLVVRALPPAGAVSSSVLGSDLVRALRRVGALRTANAAEEQNEAGEPQP